MYFSFWDTWHFVIGNLGAFFKACTRYLLGFACVFVLGYRVHISIMAAPFDQLDILYCSFYGTIVVQCLKEGIIPTGVSQEGNLNRPLIDR